MADTFSDLEILHRYLDEITTFIYGIVANESMAIVIACEVFEAHKKKADAESFDSEESRILWLEIRARGAAIDYLKKERHEEIKTRATK